MIKLKLASGETPTQEVQEWLEKCGEIISKEIELRMFNQMCYGCSHPEIYDTKH